MYRIPLRHIDWIAHLIWHSSIKTMSGEIGNMLYASDGNEGTGADARLTVAYKEDPWMNKFREGDAEIFNQVFKEYYSSLVYYARNFLQEKEAAKDIAQDVLAKLWQMRGAMKNEQNIKGFLFVSTRNACLNYLRHNKVVKEMMHKLPDFFEKSATEVENVAKLETEVVSVEVLEFITKALSQMPDKYQTIIRLFYFENKSLQEVSTLLEIPYPTVSTHKIRAIKLLKTALRGLFLVFIFLYGGGSIPAPLID
jgi:RNA polymerase sigma-70 factor (family 1)